MMAEETPDATGEVLRRVRAAVGPELPVVGTLDLHANVTALMVEQATALVGYQTAPHVDMYQAGIRAAEFLLGTIRREISPAMALVRIPMILPPENSTHNYGPLADVIRRAQEMESKGTILHGSVYPTQPWMDTEDMASSVLVVTDNDLAAARERADQLARLFWDGRHCFVTDLISPDEAVRRARALGGHRCPL
jgi:microcystin degradation protein MlrC